MVQVTVEAKVVEKTPPYSGKPGARYILEKPYYADDVFIAEGELIEFDGLPNESMQPQNEAAYHNLSEFFRLNGGGATPAVADMMEKAMRERPREGTVTRMNESREIPLTGGPAAEGHRAVQPKDPSVKQIPQADQPKYVRPIKTQGTVIDEAPGKGSI